MLEFNKIHHGNHLNILKNIGDGEVNLTVTSPPYDDLRKYNGYKFDSDDIVLLAKELYRVTKEGGVVVWIVGDATQKGSETGSSFQQALTFKYVGFNLHDTMIYHKDNPPPVGGVNRYYQAFEYMFILSKGSPKLNPILVPRRNKWNDKRTQRFRAVTRDKDGNFNKKVIPTKENVKKQNVWTYVVSGGSSSSDKIAHKHPAIFPEKLAEDHILSWSKEGDVVLDPMCGSGTTCVMAKKNKRKFIGIDISEEYCGIANKRLRTV